jgi:uncharacterized protein DUF1905
MATDLRFAARVRHWRDDPPGGLAVIDIPHEFVARLGGRRQRRIAGTIRGTPFSGSTMLVAGGGFCVGVSKAALATASVAVGEIVEVSLED